MDKKWDDKFSCRNYGCYMEDLKCKVKCFILFQWMIKVVLQLYERVEYDKNHLKLIQKILLVMIRGLNQMMVVNLGKVCKI